MLMLWERVGGESSDGLVSDSHPIRAVVNTPRHFMCFSVTML